jgi:hypothetical protein
MKKLLENQFLNLNYVNMILKLRARHFKDTEFCGKHNGKGPCAIEKALHEIFKNTLINECFDRVYVGGLDNRHYHERYDSETFHADQKQAEILNYSEDVIREINIPTLQEPSGEELVVISDQFIWAEPIEELQEA